mgnify:FL=1
MKTIKGDNKMRKTTVINREPKQSVLPIIGGVLIAFAVADFALSYAGVNLTSFLGPASRFSPIVVGLIGGALLNSK